MASKSPPNPPAPEPDPNYAKWLADDKYLAALVARRVEFQDRKNME